MQNKLNKKGVAEVVQVLLIMVLSIFAIIAVSSYILNLSDSLESKLSHVADCLMQKSTATKACYNQNSKLIELKLNIIDPGKLILKIGIGEDVFNCGTDISTCSTCNLREGNQKIYLPINQEFSENQKILYQFNTCSSNELKVKACAEP